MFDLSKIFNLSNKFALPDTFLKSKNYTQIEIFWSDLTFKQQSSQIYRSAGTPVIFLSTLVYSEVALECLLSGKSKNFVA